MPDSEHPLRAGFHVVVRWLDAGRQRRSFAARVGRVDGSGLLIQAEADPAVHPDGGPADWPALGSTVELCLPEWGGRAVLRARVQAGERPGRQLALKALPGGRRAVIRRLHRVDVDLDVPTSAGAARIINLSGKGCELVLDGPALPAIGSTVTVDLDLGGAVRGRFAVRGRVVRHALHEVRRPRVGLEFLGQTQRQEDLIVRYVFVRERELLRLGLRPWRRRR